MPTPGTAAARSIAAAPDRRGRRLAPAPGPLSARRGVGVEAADYIRKLIYDGYLKPGQRVPQDQIAEHLNISRIPIREGLVALERDGWLTLELNRGAFVNALDVDAVIDSYELYGVVYGFATRRAMIRTQGGLVDALASIERSMREDVDVDEFLVRTVSFHNTIVAASRSPRVKAMLRVSRGLVVGNFFEQIPGSIEVECRYTKAIVRALKAGDVDKAVEDYRRMMLGQGKLVAKEFKERGLFAE
jgi:DNA-binding GntR family transcriptional regulator